MLFGSREQFPDLLSPTPSHCKTTLLEHCGADMRYDTVVGGKHSLHERLADTRMSSTIVVRQPWARTFYDEFLGHASWFWMIVVMHERGTFVSVSLGEH